MKGQQVIVHAFSNKLPGKIISLDYTINNKTEEVIKTKPKKLIKNDIAMVTIKVESKIVLELGKNNRSMGRIALRDGQTTIAAGVVEEFIY